MNSRGQVLGHDSAFNGLDAYLFKGFRKTDEFRGVIEFSAMGQPPGPGEYAGYRVGAGLHSLLVLPK